MSPEHVATLIYPLLVAVPALLIVTVLGVIRVATRGHLWILLFTPVAYCAVVVGVFTVVVLVTVVPPG